MKKIILSAAVLAIAFTACKKDETTTPAVVDTTSDTKEASTSAEVTSATTLMVANSGTSGTTVTTDPTTKVVTKSIVVGTETISIKVDTNGVAKTMLDGKEIVGKIQTDGSVKGTLVDGAKTLDIALKADNSYTLKETELAKDSSNKTVTVITDRMVNADGSGTETVAANGVKVITGTKAVDGSATFSVYKDGIVVVKAIQSVNATNGPDSYTDASGKVLDKNTAEAILATIPNFMVVTGGGSGEGNGGSSGGGTTTTLVKNTFITANGTFEVNPFNIKVLGNSNGVSKNGVQITAIGSQNNYAVLETVTAIFGDIKSGTYKINPARFGIGIAANEVSLDLTDKNNKTHLAQTGTVELTVTGTSSYTVVFNKVTIQEENNISNTGTISANIVK